MINPEHILSSIDPSMILKDSHDAFLVTDQSMKIIYANYSAHTIFGYSENEIIGMNILDLMPDDRRENYSKDMENALSGKIVTNVGSGKQFFGLKKNGEIFPVELTYKSITIENKILFISQIRDISARQNYINEIEITSVSLKIINEANRLLIRSINEKEYIQGICDIITGIGGYSKSLILYITDTNGERMLSPAGYSGYHDIILVSRPFKLCSIINSGSPTVISIKDKRTEVCKNIKARGLWKYWKDSPEEMEFDSTISVPIIILDEVIGILRVYSFDPFSFDVHEVELLEELARDISYGITVLRTKNEHNKAQKALQESENKYKVLFQNSNDAIFLADAETGIIIDANEKAEDLLGFKSKEIVGIHYLEICPEGYKDKFINLLKNKSGESDPATTEMYIRTRSLKAIPVQVTSNIIYISDKKIILGIFRDISQLKNQEEKLREIQKMEALGTLSGGIAHDINNILSPVIGFTQIAILETEDEHKRLNCLNEVLTAANRAKEIVSQILTFSRKSDTEKKPHKINNIVKEVLKLISVTKPGNIRFVTNIDDSCDQIICDPVQIYQVVINLCTNALYAMKDNGGILKVCLVKKGSQEIKIEQSEKIMLDDYICLTVSDTGCGMNKTILNRIFEPYFTTKPEGESSGLGLSVVSGIVKEHNGEIYVRTYPDEGTYFRIIFPVVRQSLKEEEEGSKTLLITRKKPHVLIVDDEPQITFMFKYMLEELGCSSDSYNDPSEAIDVFRSDPEKFDLILTDQTMPGLSGTELSKLAMGIKPGIPIILNTGYSPVVSKSEALQMGINQFIMKPVTIFDLAAAINNSIK